MPRVARRQYRTMECTCALCSSLMAARTALADINSDQTTLQANMRLATNIAVAMNFLSDAQANVHRAHNPGMYANLSGDPLPQHGRRSSSLVAIPDHAALPSDGGTTTLDEPEMVRSFGMGIPVPASPTELTAFEHTLRSRAASLGILRGQTPPGSDEGIIIQRPPIVRNDKFLCCDHCRSHGLKCNEAAVCKECILRKVPCTHRACDISPNSKENCTRPVCFYVHSDFMPDLHGVHNPADPNWIVLPGKLREHLSAGKLGRLEEKSDQEVQAAYQGTLMRQQHAINEMKNVVERGEATYATIAMSCKCIEIEAEEARMKEAQEALQRMTLPGSMGV